MLVEDAVCKVCQSVFCCASCRYKHQIKNHAIAVRQINMIDSHISISTTTSTVTTTTTTTTTSSIPKAAEEEERQCNAAVSELTVENVYLFCPICEQQPLPLQSDIYPEMLVHLQAHHLPLRCEKCSKMYYNVDDLKQFTKCMRPSQLCQSKESSSNQSCESEDASKVTVTRAAAPSVHISPMRRQDFNDSHMTPISIINMRWKAKSKASHEEFISDSVSSIKNISSISNSSIRRSIGVASAVKGKVIRSTSTPVQLEMVFAKPKEQTFNASGGGHMSSIYNSGCDSDISPALPQPSSQAIESMNRYRKVNGGRPKISAVTPLRHVMSKSIQKAFAEHGLPTSSTAVRGSTTAYQRKKMFDATSPVMDGSVTENQSPVQPALDLRLSPVVRRSKSESEELQQQTIFGEQHRMQRNVPNMRRKILLSAQKLTTESIVITRTEHMSSVSSSNSAVSSNGSIDSVKPHMSNNSAYQSAESNNSAGSVFKSCSSVEIITATTAQIQKIQSVETTSVKNILPPITPITRIPGAIINKKFIKFETPKVNKSDSRDTPNSPSDIFFTPNATPKHKSNISPEENHNSAETRNRNRLLVPQNLNGRFSSPNKRSIKDCAHSTAFSRIENVTDIFEADDDDEDIEDEVFVPETKNIVEKKEETKQKSAQSNGGLWSIMSSVMGIPSRKGSNTKSTAKNENSQFYEANSCSIMKRCASIAGSLVRSKPLVDENELNTLKRKRTYTTSDHSTSSYLAQLNNSEATSPTSDSFNTSSKRFRIHGRRPIERMRLNS